MNNDFSQWLFSSRLVFIVRVVFGITFIYAGVTKIVSPQAFADILRGYDVLPLWSLNIAAISLPWVEIFLGIILPMPFWRGGSASLALSLFCVFFTAVFSSIIRGINVDCGCFSSAVGSDPVTWFTVARDVILMALGVYLLMASFREDG